MDPYLGKTIDGRYLVEQAIGEGGMGVVYRGKHKLIDKKVAIKILRVDMARDREMTERFLQEAKAASSIGNPHIVDISDFGQLPDGSTYFVMEYLAGRSLTDLMSAARPVPVPRLLHIAMQISAGLGAAHDAGIVHRDLKPDNVMLVDRGQEKDFVKILDFGIAKVGGEASRLTRAGSVFGTPHYMSPEQAAGTPVDQRTDIYSLGVILYEMASGKVPFDADNFMGILTQHMYKKPPWIRELVPTPDVPPGLDAIIQKCLTKKPEYRYQSMTELQADLDKLDQGLLPDAVQEMMARSGGFNVPADYFRQSAMPVPVPATPGAAPQRSVPKWVPVLAGFTLVGLVLIGLLIKEMRSSAEPEPASSVAPPPSSGAQAAPAPQPSDSSPVVEIRRVAIATEPADAVIKRDGVVLGKSPKLLELKPGEVANLVVSHPHYKDRSVVIDGTQAEKTITLDPVAAPSHGSGKGSAKTAPQPSAVTPQQSSGGVGEIKDPWNGH